MEFGASDSDGVHFVIRDDDAFWILVGVEFAVDREAGARCRGGDQVDDHAIADQRCGAPVLTDEREQAVLDLVPLCAAATYAERSNAQEPYGSCLKDDGGPIGIGFQKQMPNHPKLL